MQTITLMENIPQPSKERRSTSISNYLRDMIFDGTLKPGDRLPTEEKLCRHFSVSRTTLREAVQMLRVTGFLDVTPGRGSFVTKPDWGHMMKDMVFVCGHAGVCAQDVTNIRLSLQVDMLRKACQAGAQEKKGLCAYALSRSARAEENEENERRWHLGIADLAGNRMGRLLLEGFLAMGRRETIRRLGCEEHVMRAISVQIRVNTAVMSGDADMAVRVFAPYLDGQALDKGSYAAT